MGLDPVSALMPPIPPAPTADNNAGKKRSVCTFVGVRDLDSGGGIAPLIAPPDPDNTGKSAIKVINSVGFSNKPFAELPPAIPSSQKAEIERVCDQNLSLGGAVAFNYGKYFSTFAAYSDSEPHNAGIDESSFHYVYRNKIYSSQSYGFLFQLPVANSSFGLGYTGNDTKREYLYEKYSSAGYDPHTHTPYAEQLLESDRGKAKKHSDSIILDLNKGNISTDVIYSKQTGKSHGELIWTAGIQKLHFLDRFLGSEGFNPKVWPPSIGFDLGVSSDRKAGASITIGKSVNAGYSINNWDTPQKYGEFKVMLSAGLGVNLF